MSRDATLCGARLVERRPRAALSLLVLLTLVLGVFATQQTTDTDLTACAPASELGQALDQIQAEFGSSGTSIQVVVDAGVDGDVLTSQGLEAAARIARIAADTPELAAVLAPSTPQAPAIASYATSLTAALDAQGTDAATVDEATIDRSAASLLTSESGGPAAALFSRDLDPAAAQAQAGLVLVRLSPDADTAALSAGELAFADALEGADFDGLDVSPFGQAILADSLTSGMSGELPLLLGISLLLIVGILYLTYRRFSDVLLGFAGLLVTIVWTFGLAVILGPDCLGLTGPFSQISTVVPVLLIGLGIDYAIHLTSRYREQQLKGDDPTTAAGVAVRAVGGALILATVTTLVGFLTNIASPLPPIADFGIFVAGGVLSAFVVMLLLIPSARSLLDQRHSRHDVSGPDGDGNLQTTSHSNGLASLMGRTAVLAERHLTATLAVAAVITVAAGTAGTQISTTFSQDDFIPADSEIGALLDDITELFGGGVDEQTFVLMRGDLDDPAVVNAMITAKSAMANTDGIRAPGGNPQVSSPASVVARLAADPDLADQFTELGWTGNGVSSDADVASMYALAGTTSPEMLGPVLNSDATVGLMTMSTTAGQDGAGALRSAIEEDIAALDAAGVDATVASEPLVLDETLHQLTQSQTRSILLTLGISLVVLVLFFGLRERRPLLGVVTMIPSALVVAWVLGSMWLFGISFNVLTAMVASLAIGIGVPFGIHVTHRFLEDSAQTDDVDAALRETVTHTGGALAGSAATTAADFGVLAFSSLAPLQQFGLITALTIVFSLVAAVLVQPACLKVWANYRQRRDGGQPQPVRREVHAAR